MRISDWSSDVCSSDLPIRFMIDARSSSDLPLTFTSPVLPFGATLNPSTGEFNWTPTYIQDGIYEIPFEVSDGETTVSFTMHIDVLAAHAADRKSVELGKSVAGRGDMGGRLVIKKKRKNILK